MENSFLFAGLTGIITGCIHVLTGPDHMAAVAPFSAQQPAKSWRVGFTWALGHTASVWILAITAFLLKGFIPLNGLSHWSEKAVGLTLIAIGLWSFRKALSRRVHYHIHSHDGVEHAHFHSHSIQAMHHHHDKGHQHSHAPLGIGILHGFAGSTHIIPILPALALPGISTAVAYMGGFGVGTIISMICFSWFIGLVMKKLVRGFTRAYQSAQLVLACVAISTGVLWLTLAG